MSACRLRIFLTLCFCLVRGGHRACHPAAIGRNELKRWAADHLGIRFGTSDYDLLCAGRAVHVHEHGIKQEECVQEAEGSASAGRQEDVLIKCGTELAASCRVVITALAEGVIFPHMLSLEARRSASAVRRICSAADVTAGNV